MLRAAPPILLLLCAWASLLPGAGCSTAPRDGGGAPRRGDASVVIISIDGLRPEFYRGEPGIEYEAPTLKRLALLGASADGAEAIYPSLTYPSHTAIVTGLNSDRTGIDSNTLFDPTPGAAPRWYWEASHLKAPTLWGEAKRQGKRVAILTWPVTVGADADWLIPEIFPGSPMAGESTWDLTRRHMDPAYLKDITDHLGPDDEKVMDGFAQRDRFVTSASRYTLGAHHPDLALVHLIEVDHAAHETGKSSPETRAALKVADAQLARIIEPLDLAKTTLFVLGDHGFYDYDKVIHLNALFARQGWLREKQGKAQPDWKVIARLSGSTAAIYSRDPRLAPRVIALLKRNAGSLYRVLERDELDRLGAFPGAICAADPLTSIPGPGGRQRPGYSMGNGASGPLVTDAGRVRGNHGSDPTVPQLRAGFIAVGPGIPAGLRLGTVRLIDVAPTAARILGVSLPHPQGRAMELGSPRP